MCVCVCVRVRDQCTYSHTKLGWISVSEWKGVRACVRACVCVCDVSRRVCVCVCVCVCARSYSHMFLFTQRDDHAYPHLKLAFMTPPKSFFMLPTPN